MISVLPSSLSDKSASSVIDESESFYGFRILIYKSHLYLINQLVVRNHPNAAKAWISAWISAIWQRNLIFNRSFSAGSIPTALKLLKCQSKRPDFSLISLATIATRIQNSFRVARFKIRYRFFAINFEKDNKISQIPKFEIHDKNAFR